MIHLFQRQILDYVPGLYFRSASLVLKHLIKEVPKSVLICFGFYSYLCNFHNTEGQAEAEVVPSSSLVKFRVS